jgi:hypothetical protein
MADPAGSHQLAFGDRADLDGEGHLQEDVAAHADDVGQLGGSVDQGRPAGPGPDEVGRDDLVGDGEVSVPQLQQPSAVELLVGLHRHGAPPVGWRRVASPLWRASYRPVVRMPADKAAALA